MQLTSQWVFNTNFICSWRVLDYSGLYKELGQLVRARVIHSDEIKHLEETEKTIQGKREYVRLQSVLLRVRQGKTAKEIGDVLGLHPRTVEKHQERYFKEGLKAFEPKQPGPKKGEGPRLMSQEQEQAVLEKLESQASQGQVLKGAQVKEAVEKELGKTISLSASYTILHRNGWQKQSPRPKHPKGDDEAKVLFKKIR